MATETQGAGDLLRVECWCARPEAPSPSGSDLNPYPRTNPPLSAPHPSQTPARPLPPSDPEPLARQRPQAYYRYQGCSSALASVEPRLSGRRAEFTLPSSVKLAAAPSSEASGTEVTVTQARACCADMCRGGAARQKGDSLRPLPAPLALPHWPACHPEGRASHLVRASGPLLPPSLPGRKPEFAARGSGWRLAG